MPRVDQGNIPFQFSCFLSIWLNNTGQDFSGLQPLAFYCQRTEQETEEKCTIWRTSRREDESWSEKCKHGAVYWGLCWSCFSVPVQWKVACAALLHLKHECEELCVWSTWGCLERCVKTVLKKSCPLQWALWSGILRITVFDFSCAFNTIHPLLLVKKYGRRGLGSYVVS